MFIIVQIDTYFINDEVSTNGACYYFFLTLSWPGAPLWRRPSPNIKGRESFQREHASRDERKFGICHHR